MAGLQKGKLDSDRQDLEGALDRSQKYLDSLRDNQYRYHMSAQQRQQFSANLALAYANLQSQFDLLKAQAGYRAVGI
jgi:hypothetical protein